MIKGYYKIADTIIEINSIYDFIHKMCRNYKIQDKPADVIVNICQEDIEYERANSDGEGYPDRYLETLAVHRKMANQLVGRNILLFHGSAVAVDGQAYIFTAKSGTGKSTHARLWRQKFADRAVMVNDDKPMLKANGSGVAVCGTPWNGKHHLDTNIEIPVKAICIIHQAKENHIEKISFDEALPVLMEQTYRPTDGAGMDKILEMFGFMASFVSFYRMGCNMDPEAADVAWKGMQTDDREHNI